MIKIHRPFYTLPELAKRWKLPAGSLDLHRAIMDGTLKPCVMLDAPLHPVAAIDGAPMILRDVEMQQVRQWLYPAFTTQIEPFNYRFDLLCNMVSPVEGCTLWGLPTSSTLFDFMSQAVVMAEDVAAAEAALIPVRDDDTLSTKEKNSLSAICATMAFELYGWEPGSEKCTGTTELLRAAEALGLRLSYNTVKSHLTECWQRAKPLLA